MKKLKYVLFTILLFLINISIVSAKDDVINRIDVSITLDKYGNAHIEEIWDVKANMGTEFYKAEYNLGNMEISNFKVYENGKEFIFVKGWDIDASMSEKAYKNGFNFTSDGIELCWGKGSLGNHTFKIVYDVSNFVFKTDDSDVLYWQVINQGMTSVPKNFTLTLNSFYSFPDTLDVWGYGYKGYAYVNNGKIYMSNEENTNMTSGDYAVLLVKFPLNTFIIDESNTYNDFNSFDDVLTRAEEGSFSYDYNNENILFDVIIPILFSFVFPLIFVFVVIFLANQSKYKFESLGRKIDYKNIRNFRDIPCKKDIFRAYFIAQAYKINQNEADILGSVFLKWLFEDKIEIEKRINKTLFGEKEEQVIILKNDVTFNTGVEKEFYDILKRASKDSILENRELSNWSKNNYNKLFNLLKSFEAYGRSIYQVEGFVYKEKSKYVIKDTLKPEAINLAGLKKYLIEFSRIKEKTAIEVKLWKEYLMFAQIFGIADKVAEQFKNLYPKEIYDMSSEYNFDMTDIIIINSISHNAISSATSARAAAQSYSSGGGGFSSGGGGGGSFGGGGGGGR